MWEERHRKGPRAAAGSVEAESSRERGGGGFDPAALLLEYFGADNRKQVEPAMSKEESVITTIRCLDQYSGEGNEAEIDIDGIQNLQEWVRLETEKCATILEQRHHAEVEAFTEQMRLKDEKLEAFHWQILSMELETKRLHSHIDRLEESLSQSRDESLRLESQLSDRERELKSLKEEFSFFVQQCQKNSKYFASEVKVTKRKTREKEQEAKAVSNFDQVENNGDPKFMLLESQHNVESICRDTVVNDIITTTPSDSAPPTDHSDEHSVTCVDEFPSEAGKLEKPSWDQAWVITPTVQSPKEEIEEEKEVTIDPVHVQIKNNSLTDAGAASKLTSVRQSFALKHSSWKMDIHALGVSYRIKRLKQQLLVLEKLAAKYIITKDSILQHSNEIEGDNAQHLKGFALVTTLLNKQVKRFQSLEEKTDNLCRRMHENSRGGSRMDSSNGKTKEQTRILESFLEEAFQLQRFTVATGQKLMDIQSRISGSFADNDGLDESAGFNMVQFADVIRTLFKEIHRGLEVRIARIIGDLEGTLACDGILHR